jgi:hypothetical protein
MIDDEPLADGVSRTHLLLAHLGLIEDLGNANRWLAQNHVHIAVGSDACRSTSAQAAVMTAVTLAARASLRVHVSLEEPDAEVTSGHLRGLRIADALRRLGATDNRATLGAHCLLIGAATAPDNGSTARLQVTWKGWTAALRPAGTRLADDEDNILAAIAAAALSISEIFHGLLGNLEAGWRDVTLSLWDPTTTDPLRADGPPLQYLPAQWLIVGLGHLGQAAAWCLSHLPYADDSGELWLVDDDVASRSNVSTGVLTDPAAAIAGTRKTRLVESCLNQAGRVTRLWEARLPASYRYEVGHPQLALIGVDNAQTRLSLSQVGWPLCIDAGLGSTPSSFSSFGIHVFPGKKNSADIEAWRETAARIQPSKLPRAFERLVEKEVTDQCGAVVLAGRVVAAAFVGVLASCFAIAEPLRSIHGGLGVDSLAFELHGTQQRTAISNRHPPRLSLLPITVAR